MLPIAAQPFSAYFSAIGIGLLIGVVRERQRLPEEHLPAGLRTHTLAALIGAVAWNIHYLAFVTALLAVCVLSYAAYQRSSDKRPGQTGEMALILTTLLGGLAHMSALQASALAVVVAVLLLARKSLHRIGRELLQEHELQDGLLLLGAALVVLPLLPDRAIDPEGVLNPAKLWRLVVLVMSISAAGHVALRLVGSRWGMAIAGFFAGFVSSTAAIAGFGQRVRSNPRYLNSSVAASMLAACASLLLTFPILATVSTTFMLQMLPQLAAFGGVLAVGGLLGLRQEEHQGDSALPTSDSRMFSLSHALLFAAVIAMVLLISVYLQKVFGDSGALLTAGLAALVELHAAVASIGQMAASKSLSDESARWGLAAVLFASIVARSIVAFISGGKAFGARVTAGFVIAMLAFIAAGLISPIR